MSTDQHRRPGRPSGPLPHGGAFQCKDPRAVAFTPPTAHLPEARRRAIMPISGTTASGPHAPHVKTDPARLGQTRLPAPGVPARRPWRTVRSAPGPARWQWLSDRLLLWLGCLCLGAGLSSSSPSTGRPRGRLSRLALLSCPCSPCWWCSGGPCRHPAPGPAAGPGPQPRRPAGPGGLTYQTGADPWQLFATWALMLLPLAALGRSPLLWTLLAWLLGQLALGALLAPRPVRTSSSPSTRRPRLVPDPAQRRPLGPADLVPARFALMPSWIRRAGRRARHHPATPAGPVQCRLPWSGTLSGCLARRLPALAPQVHRRASPWGA